MNYAGIDLGLNASAVHVIDANGDDLRMTTVATEGPDLLEALSGLGSLKVILEASPCAEWVKRALDAGGHDCEIIDSRAAKKLMSSKKKTDRRDARVLAEIGRSGWYTVVRCKSEAGRKLRTWLKAREGLLETQRAQDSRIRGLLRAHGIRIGHVGAAGYEARVRKRVEAQAPELWPCIAPLLELWRQAREDAKQLKKCMKRWVESLPGSAEIQSVPSLGPLFASVMISTIEDPHRFEGPKQVGGYVGLAPSVYQSGDRDARGRITKDGDVLFRSLAVESATVLMRRYQGDCALKRWALRLEQEKGFAKARVALARKLVVLAWTLWARGERFDPQRGIAVA